MGSQGSIPLPNARTAPHIQLEQGIRGGLDEFSRTPICYAETYGSSNWCNLLPQNKLTTVKAFPTQMAMAVQF